MSKKTEEKQSFITEARRAQIVDAAITTLDEIGFANASLAQIAKRAGISTALISYHFRDKNELMDYTLMALVGDSAGYVLERTGGASSNIEKLHTYIAASLAYQATRPRHSTALIEIIFHSRTPDNVPYYKIGDDDEDPLAAELQRILVEGQTRGEFRAFNVEVMASVIQGAIGEYMFNKKLTDTVDLEAYSDELISLFDRMVQSDNRAE
ncbi:TetR/AcrR family transcriptional regulator [Paenibacillus methanolicus]|uniref:AcrR family transcriptional regulator n=1 Tax=Paenibacillus methanolicus TaxID=582686 RepID=A0A5S5BRL3_9BACL|nr:TetR/AcrR family transcriptional regulator [Paenibacillus methanolicus]TYP68936.1 AcrR family transcriptional regulator [Paenibacillus methanolicus]